MITPKEKAEKIRSAPRHSERIFRNLTPEQREQHAKKALEHENDPGRMSSVDEYVYLKKCEADGK